MPKNVETCQDIGIEISQTGFMPLCLRSYKIHKGGGCECIYQGGQLLGWDKASDALAE